MISSLLLARGTRVVAHPALARVTPLGHRVAAMASSTQPITYAGTSAKTLSPFHIAIPVHSLAEGASLCHGGAHGAALVACLPHAPGDAAQSVLHWQAARPWHVL